MFLKKRNETPQPDRAGNPSGCGVFLCFFLHKIAIEQKADPQSGGGFGCEKRKSRKDNMSGFRGVFQLKNCNRYRVDIGFKGKRYYVGLFDNYDEAVQARLAAENLIHNGFIQKWKEWNEKEKENPEWGKEHPLVFDVKKEDGEITIKF